MGLYTIDDPGDTPGLEGALEAIREADAAALTLIPKLVQAMAERKLVEHRRVVSKRAFEFWSGNASADMRAELQHTLVRDLCSQAAAQGLLPIEEPTVRADADSGEYVVSAMAINAKFWR
jgi:hypothetical protein